MAKQKIRNPFIHSHEHDHDHDHNGHGHGHHHHHGDGHHHHHHHDSEDISAMDPAQQSLADALRVSFGVLKWVMVLLLVAYLLSGIFRVPEQERAVRLRFGKIVGETTEEQVYGPGWHFGLPYPIEQVITVPINQRSVSLAQAFWFQAPPGSEGQTLDQMQGGPLSPERDGSLLTGDANIVHGQFSVRYVITDPAEYVQNVGDLGLADQLVRNAAEQAIVYAVAQAESDQVIRNQINRRVATDRMQGVLDQMRTGISVEGATAVVAAAAPAEPGAAAAADAGAQSAAITVERTTMPLRVRGAYQAVINAESEKGRLIEEARQQRTSILNDAAGAANDALFDLVQEYELARAANDEARAEALSEQIDRAFSELRVTTAEGVSLPIGGRAAEVISQAMTDRVQTVEQIKSEANTFRSLLEQYRQSPELVKTQLWQAAREQIMTGEDVETMYAATNKTLTISVNRDPQIQREREERRLQATQEAAQQQPSP